MTGRSLTALACAFGLAISASLVDCSSTEETPPPDAGGSDATDAGADVIVDVTAEPEAAADAGPCADASPDELPPLLSCAGLYTDIATKTVAPSAVAYQPGIELWSDGAAKKRWLSLPPNSVIDVTDLDEWKFPVGTRAYKEFSLNGKRIETRVLWKRGPTDWTWTTYVWAADESEATRKDDGAKNYVGTYEIPDKNTCDQCHNGRKDKLLGIEAIALALPTAQGITMDGLAKAGRLAPLPAKTTIALPEDATGKAAAALGHLHMNCGVACHNHNPGAGAAMSGLYLRLPAAPIFAGTATVAGLESATSTLNQPITSANFFTFKSNGYTRITPKDSAKSLVPALMDMRGTFQMPPIASHEPDTGGAVLVKAWVDAL